MSGVIFSLVLVFLLGVILFYLVQVSRFYHLKAGRGLSHHYLMSSGLLLLAGKVGGGFWPHSFWSGLLILAGIVAVWSLVLILYKNMMSTGKR